MEWQNVNFVAYFYRVLINVIFSINIDSICINKETSIRLRRKLQKINIYFYLKQILRIYKIGT